MNAGIFFKAAEGNDAETVQRYLDRGFDPDDRNCNFQHSPTLPTAVAFGAIEAVHVLVAALRKKYRDSDPKKYMEVLYEGTKGANVINRTATQFIDLFSKDKRWGHIHNAAWFVQEELYATIESQPREEQLLLRTKYPFKDFSGRFL